MIIRKLEALFTINTNAAQFKKATQQLETLSDKVEGIMKAVAGYWAVQALHNFVLNTSNAMAELGKSSQYLGITAQALQELQFAAEKSGVSVDALHDSIKELQVRSFDAKSGEGEAAKAFKTLGVKATDAADRIREPLELLDEVADKFMTLPTPGDRLWVADAMFGDEGATILKMLHEGSSGLRRMRQEARALGIVINPQSIQKAQEFNQALTMLRFSARGTGNVFVQELMGPLSGLMKILSAVSFAFNQLEGRASIVRIALISLGGIVAAIAIKAGMALAPFVVPFLPLIAAITAASFAVEDLWVAFKGGDSVIAATFQGVSGFAQAAQIALTKGFKEAFLSIQHEFAKFSNWITTGLARLVEQANQFIAGLVPEFFKDGFSAKAQQILPMAASTYGPHQLNARLTPKAPLKAQSPHYTHSQNVSVAVNVQSGANPHEIGGEVSKAVRKELERERFNAFMGVTQYAG